MEQTKNTILKAMQHKKQILEKRPLRRTEQRRKVRSVYSEKRLSAAEEHYITTLEEISTADDWKH